MNMGIIAWIVLGLIAGVLAKTLLRQSEACNDTASVTCSPSSANRRIAGTRPTVDTVTERCEIPNPDGAGSQIRCTASTTRR